LRLRLNNDTATCIQANVAMVTPLGFSHHFPVEPVVGGAEIATLANHRIGTRVATARIGFNIVTRGNGNVT